MGPDDLLVHLVTGLAELGHRLLQQPVVHRLPATGRPDEHHPVAHLEAGRLGMKLKSRAGKLDEL